MQSAPVAQAETIVAEGPCQAEFLCNNVTATISHEHRDGKGCHTTGITCFFDKASTNVDNWTYHPLPNQ